MKFCLGSSTRGYLRSRFFLEQDHNFPFQTYKGTLPLAIARGRSQHADESSESDVNDNVFATCLLWYSDLNGFLWLLFLTFLLSRTFSHAVTAPCLACRTPPSTLLAFLFSFCKNISARASLFF